MKTKQILFGLGALTLSGIAYWYFTKGKVDEIKSNVTAKNKKK